MEQEQKKKLGRPFANHKNKNIGYSIRNDDPILLQPPLDHISLTDERFQYLISMQKQWRTEYLQYKKLNTKYQQNKII